MGNINQAIGGSPVAYQYGNTQILSSTTIDVAGSWVELISSVPENLNGFYLNMNYMNSSRAVCDIGLGASGSEVVIVEELLVEHYTTNAVDRRVEIPIHIPAGERVSFRMTNRASGSQANCYVTLNAWTMGMSTPYPYQVMEHLGRVVVVAGESPSFGSYTEISSSLPHTYKSFIVGIDHNLQGATASYGVVFEVALGAASSEETLPVFLLGASDTQDDNIVWSHLTKYPLCLPAGERLSVRSYATVTSGDEDKGFHVWGLR